MKRSLDVFRFHDYPDIGTWYSATRRYDKIHSNFHEAKLCIGTISNSYFLELVYFLILLIAQKVSKFLVTEKNKLTVQFVICT